MVVGRRDRTEPPPRGTVDPAHALSGAIRSVAAVMAVASAQNATQSWFAKSQLAGGRVAARDDRQPDPADLRVTVWLLLSVLGDGSTIRSGPP